MFVRYLSRRRKLGATAIDVDDGAMDEASFASSLARYTAADPNASAVPAEQVGE